MKEWQWPYTLDDFLFRWFDEEKNVDEQVLRIVQLVRQSGIHCYIATNQEKYRVDYLRKQLGFDLIFDGIFDSATIGLRKPSLAFYEAVGDSLGVSGKNILYWDDSPANVMGARQYGWNSELYIGFQNFVTTLGHFSVIDNSASYLVQ